LKICIENEKVPVNKADEHGFTALHYASREGSLKAVKYLLGMGADVHLRTTYQFTPLYLAAINRHEAVVYQLIEKGAVSTQLTGWQLDTVKKRATPFTWLMLTDRQKMKAQETMQYQLIRFLANSQLSAADSMYAREKPDVNYWHYGEGINAAFATIFRNQQPGLQWLIDHGLDVNLTNAAIDGFTPLMAAAYIDNAEAAQLLLKHGANRLVRDRKGNTALDVARQNNSKTVMALLEQ
jgi:ankyrin repeat protein